VPESRHELVIAALQTALATIVGDGGATYWFSPDRVLRAPAFTAQCLDASLETIYVLSPEDVAEVHGDSCDEKDTLRVDLTAVRRFNPPTENPFQQAVPIRWTIQTRLERDVKKLTRADKSLGGLAQEITIPLTSYSPDETYFEGWACVFMRLEIKFHSPKAMP
jgi:hypothetical protein